MLPTATVQPVAKALEQSPSGMPDATKVRMSNDERWQPMYRIGAIAAILVLAFVPLQMAVYFAAPPPATVRGWFELYQRSQVLGLLDMDLLLIVDQLAIALVLLALCVALYRTNPSWIAIALLLTAVATAAYLTSNRAFEMLALSAQYAAATTEAERTIALAAGATMVSVWTGTAFSVGYVLGAFAFLIVTIVLMRSQVFSRATAQVGVVFAALSFVPASAGTLGIVFSIASLLPMWVWLVLLARRLLQLGRPAPASALAPTLP